MDRDGDTDDELSADDDADDAEEADTVEDVVVQYWADFDTMSQSVVYRRDRPYVHEIPAAQSSQVNLIMDKGTTHWVYISGIDSASASDACRLTGDSIVVDGSTNVNSGNIVILGYVAPYEKVQTSGNEWRCGVLVYVDETLNTITDPATTHDVVLTGGDADINIQISIAA